MTTPASENQPSFVVRQEPDHVDRTKVVGGAVIVALGIAVSVGVTILLLTAFFPDDAARVGRTPPPVGTVEHSLILATERGLTERNTQRGALDRYGWVDRDAGIARIPIEEAMRLVAAEGVDLARADGGRAR